MNQRFYMLLAIDSHIMLFKEHIIQTILNPRKFNSSENIEICIVKKMVWNFSHNDSPVIRLHPV
jgi:hypothetical protein